MLNAEAKAQEFLRRHNETADDIAGAAGERNAVARFIAEMEKGLSGRGGSIPMIPTYISNIDNSKIKGGKRILIDAGGTNFRSASGCFDEDGRVSIERLEKRAMPASGGEELTAEEFYGRIAQYISRLAAECGDIGFCFSYPVNMSADLDGEALNFSKEIRAPQVVGTRVGERTLAALKKYDSKKRKIVILNDTVASLLGGMAISRKRYSAYLGYIYGTGTNICCVVDTAKITKVSDLPKGEMLVNTECGGYIGFTMGDFDKAAVAKTASPNSQLFEKLTSGKYLAEIICEAFKTAVAEGELCGETRIGRIELKDVSQFLEGRGGVVADMFVSEADSDFAKTVCAGLIDRAAKMGATANAATAVFTCKDKTLPVAVVAEGTTFNRLTGYRAAFEKYLKEILSLYDISYEIVQGEDLNLIGTLMATMVL